MLLTNYSSAGRPPRLLRFVRSIASTLATQGAAKSPRTFRKCFLRLRRANANHPDHGSLMFAIKKLLLPTGRRQVQLIMDDAPKEQNPKVAFRPPLKQS